MVNKETQVTILKNQIEVFMDPEFKDMVRGTPMCDEVQKIVLSLRKVIAILEAPQASSPSQ
jgi:hypothetical protein